MASGSSTPTSADSYTEAAMVAKLGVVADIFDYFKVLLTKGVKARGKKAQKCKQVALACTAEEVLAFLVEKEAETLARAKKRDPGQLTLQEAIKRMRME